MSCEYYTGESQAFWANQLKQRGGSNFYVGTRFQRGSGFGSMFASLFRSIAPLAKAGMKAARPIAKKALKNLAETGISAIGESLVPGGDPKAVFKEGLRKTALQSLKQTKRKIGKKRKGQKGAGGLGSITIKKRRRKVGAISKKKANLPAFLI